MRVSKSGNVLYEINPLVELMLLDGLREHVILDKGDKELLCSASPGRDEMARTHVDATERVLVALGISFPGMPAGAANSAVIEDFLRLQGYDHPRPELDSWKWLCELAGASQAVRGKDQIVSGSVRLRPRARRGDRCDVDVD